MNSKPGYKITIFFPKTEIQIQTRAIFPIVIFAIQRMIFFTELLSAQTASIYQSYTDADKCAFRPNLFDEKWCKDVFGIELRFPNESIAASDNEAL